MDAPSGIAVGRRMSESVAKSSESDKTLTSLGVAGGGLAALKIGTDASVRGKRKITSARNTAMGARITAANAAGHLEEMKGQRPKVARTPEGKSTGRLHTIGMQREAVAATERMSTNQARRAVATRRAVLPAIKRAQNAKLAGAAAIGLGAAGTLKGLAGMNRNRRERAMYGAPSA